MNVSAVNTQTLHAKHFVSQLCTVFDEKLYHKFYIRAMQYVSTKFEFIATCR